MNSSRHRNSSLSRSGRSTAHWSQRSAARRRLRFETLEDRRLLSGNTVNNLLDVVNGDVSSVSTLHNDDGGDGVSLREAISAALNESSALVVMFDPVLFSTPQTIAIDSQLPTLNASIFINGPGADLLTIDAGNGTDGIFNTGDGYRIFLISSIADVSISGMTLTGGDTGFFGGAIANSGNLSITNSALTGNASGAQGGGIQNAPGSTLNLTKSTLIGNSAVVGGGIENRGTATILKSTFSGNVATTGRGGGLYQAGNSAAEIADSTFSGNSAVAGGGGISKFGGSLSMTNSTVSNNSTNGTGGGIQNQFGSAFISNSTISGNSAVNGGGLRSSSATVLINSIVSGSISSGDISASGGTLSGSNNLIEDGTGVLADTITGDPLLGPLADNGGPTQTHALLPGSPALTAGPIGTAASLYDYRLDTFADSQGASLDLTTLGGDGTLNGGVYEFGMNQGLETQIPTANADDYSIELYFKFDNIDATTGYQKILDFGTDTHADAGLYVYNNRLRYFVGNPIGFYTSSNLSADTWYHLVLTRDNSLAAPLTSYIDGQLQRTYPDNFDGHALGSFTAEGDSSATKVVQLFHSDNSFGQQQGGAADRVRFYDHPLASGEVADLFEAGPNTIVPALDQRGLPRLAGTMIDLGAYEAQIEPSADFDVDGDVDGADFLRWQRGFGKANAQRADGNSDDDSDVDASDLAAWTVSFGQPQPLLAVATSGQPAVGSAEFREELFDPTLIDAALALEWLGSDSDEETSYVAEQATLEAVFASGDELEDLAPTGSIASNIDAAIASSDNVESTVESTEERWLADELLERVFG